MAAPPHVLIALHQLGGGGVERVTLHLANGLARRGNRVSLVLLRHGGVLEQQLDPLVDVVRPASGGAPKDRGVGLLRAVRPLAQTITRLKPDVLLSPGNHMHPLVLLAHRRAGLGDCRLALKFTNPIERSGGGRFRNAVRAAFYRYAADQAELILTLSQSARQEAATRAPEAESKIRVVDNPYVEERLLTRKRRPAKVDPPLLLSVGRLTEQKDPLMLIEAMAGLADRPWRLAMLGDGPLRGASEARAKALGIAHKVEFAGFVPDPAPWFDKARLFLLPSRYEELPAVLFEAMVARCSIVSTAASAAVVDLLDQGRLGRIVPPADVAAFRAAVAHALDDLSPGRVPGAWIKRFTIGSGVASHAEALGLR